MLIIVQYDICIVIVANEKKKKKKMNFSEVCKALNKNRGLYGRWTELQDVVITSPPMSGGIVISRDELDWTTTELRKALRSIEWDLDDLEDTIYILCHELFITGYSLNPNVYKFT